MSKKGFFWLAMGASLVAGGLFVFLFAPPVQSAAQTELKALPHQSYSNQVRSGPLVRPSQQEGECAIYAVDGIGAWVNAGAAEGPFVFESMAGEACQGDFEADILPLFKQEDVWFEGSEACTDCQFDNSEDSRHEMDLSSLAGIMKGGDVLSEPPGVAIIVPGDSKESKLRARLRDNRMPPGWEFDIEETNRDGPLLDLDGAAIYAVDLIAAWVDAGAAEGEFAYTGESGDEYSGDFETDVLPCSLPQVPGSTAARPVLIATSTTPRILAMRWI